MEVLKMSRFRDSLFETIRYLLYGKKHSFWLGEFEWEHRDKDGNIIDKWTTYNALANEGEYTILDNFFRKQSTPETFYLMLVNDTPTIPDSLDLITGEPTGNGYERLEFTRDTTGWPDPIVKVSGHYMVISKQVTFRAIGGSWGPVIYAILTTIPTGTDGPLIAFVELSSPKTLADGESLLCRVKVRLR